LQRQGLYGIPLEALQSLVKDFLRFSSAAFSTLKAILAIIATQSAVILQAGLSAKLSFKLQDMHLLHHLKRI
jgi:hypothetical protein